MWCPRQTAHPQKGQAINNDLQPTTIAWIRCSNVQVTHHDVGRDPPTCFSAHASARTFQSETTPPQLTCPRASCAMMAKGVKGTATSAEAANGDESGAGITHGTGDSQSCCGHWKVQRREPWPTLRSEQGSLRSKHGGHDPHAESHSHGTEASCCQPCRVDPRSCSSGSLGGGRNPLASALQSGGSIRAHLSLRLLRERAEQHRSHHCAHPQSGTDTSNALIVTFREMSHQIRQQVV